MGRRSMYTTVDEKRQSQAKRDEQLKSNEEKYELNKDRERRRKNREREKLKTDSLLHSMHIAELSKQLNYERNEQSAEQDEAVEAFSLPDENISDSDIYGDQSGFGDNLSES